MLLNDCTSNCPTQMHYNIVGSFWGGKLSCMNYHHPETLLVLGIQHFISERILSIDPWRFSSKISTYIENIILFHYNNNIYPIYYAVGDPEPAEIIHSPDSYSIAVINSTFTTSCHGYGIELPVIIWNKHGMALTNDARIITNQRYVFQNSTYQFIASTLTIGSTELEDTGNYSCIARNSNGMDVHRFTLTVFVPGKWVFCIKFIDCLHYNLITNWHHHNLCSSAYFCSQ